MGDYVLIDSTQAVSVTSDAAAGWLHARAGLAVDGGTLRLAMGGRVEGGLTLGTLGLILTEGSFESVAGRQSLKGTLHSGSIIIDSHGADAANVGGTHPDVWMENAQLKTAQGGWLTVLGATIGISGSVLAAPQGRLRIGGGAYGGEGLVTSLDVRIDQTSALDASSVGAGSTGGTVVVWSDEFTHFAGMVAARGGEGGRGGWVEISSKEILGYEGTIDVTAVKGTAGSVLFDPRTITIATTGLASVVGNQFFNQSPSADRQLSVSALTDILNTGASVTLQANRDILVQASIVVNNPGGNGGTLTLEAGRSVIFSNVSYNSDGGGLFITANEQDASEINRGSGLGVINLSGASIQLGSGRLQLQVDAEVLDNSEGSISLPAFLSAGIVSVSGATDVIFSAQGTMSAQSLTLSSTNLLASIRGQVFMSGNVTVACPARLTASGSEIQGSLVDFQSTLDGASQSLEVRVLSELRFNGFVTSLSTLTLKGWGAMSSAVVNLAGSTGWVGVGISASSLTKLSTGFGGLIAGDAGSTPGAVLAGFSLPSGAALTVNTTGPTGSGEQITLSGSLNVPGGLSFRGDVLVTSNITLQTGPGRGVLILSGGRLHGPGRSITIIADALEARPTVAQLSLSPASNGKVLAIGDSQGANAFTLPAFNFGVGTSGRLNITGNSQFGPVIISNFSAPGWEVTLGSSDAVTIKGSNQLNSLAISNAPVTFEGLSEVRLQTAQGQSFGRAVSVTAPGIKLVDPNASYVFAQVPMAPMAGASIHLAPQSGVITYQARRGETASFDINLPLITSLATTNLIVKIGDDQTQDLQAWDGAADNDVSNFSLQLLAAPGGLIGINRVNSDFRVAGTLDVGVGSGVQIKAGNNIVSGGALTFWSTVGVSVADVAFKTILLENQPAVDITFSTNVPSVVRSPLPGSMPEVLSLMVATNGGTVRNFLVVGGVRNITIDGHLAGGTIRASGDVTLSGGGSGSIVVEAPAGVLTLAGAINGTSLVFEASDFEVGGTIGFNTLLRWKSTRAMVVGRSVPESGVANLTQGELARITPANAGSVTSVENVRTIQSVASAGTLRVKGELVGAERRVALVGVVSAVGGIELDSNAVMLAMGSLLTAPQILGLGNLPPVIASPGGRIVANEIEWLLYRDATLTIMPLDPDRSVAIGDPLRNNELQLSHASFLENANIQIGDGTRRLDIYLVGDGGESPITGSELASLTLRPAVGGVIRAVGLFVFGGGLVLDGPVLVEPLVVGEIPLLAAALIAFNGETNIAGNRLNIAARVLQVSGAFVGGGSIRVQDGPDVYEGSITINSTPAAGSLHLSRQKLSALTAGGASLTIGTAAAQAHQTIELYGGAEAFVTPLSLEVGGMNGRVTIRGDAVRLAATAPLSILGPGRTIFIETDILTQGAPVTFNDGVRIASPLVVIATNDGGAIQGAPISFNGELNSEENEFNALVVRSGDINPTTFAGIVGVSDGSLLGSLKISTRSLIIVDTGTVRTRGNAAFEGMVLVTRDAETRSELGEVIHEAAVEIFENDYIMAAREITLRGAMTGTGTLSFETETPARDMELAGTNDPEELDLTNDELDLIQPGFANVSFGNREGTGRLQIGAGVTFTSDTLLIMNGSGGRIRSPFTIRGTPGIRIIVIGPGQTFETAGGIIVEGGEIIINDGVRLIGPAVFDTTDGGAAVGGMIMITGGVNSAAGEAQPLLINSGFASTTLEGTIGAASGGSLGSLTITAGGGATLTGGSVRTTGEQTYNAAIDFGAGATFASTGSNVTFNGVVAGVPNIQVAAGTGVVTFNQPVELIEFFTAAAGQTFVFNSTASFGTLTLSGGDVALNGASSIGRLLMSSGQLRGLGSLTITGVGTDISGGTLVGGGVISVALGGTVLVTAPILSITRSLLISGNVTQQGGQVNLAGGGLIRTLAGGRYTLLGANPALRNGTLEIVGGTVTLAASGRARVELVQLTHTSGTLSATGATATITPAGGTYIVGGRLQAVGDAILDVTGNLTFLSQAIFSSVFVALPGRLQAPRVNVLGTATLAGTIEIGLVGRWTEPVASAVVLSASVRVGTFNRLTIAPKYLGLQPFISYVGGEVRVTLLPVFYAIAGGPP